MNIRRDSAVVQSQLDQERADLRDWLRESDPLELARFRSLIAAEDSAAMIKTLSAEDADILARLAIIAFDSAYLESLRAEE